MDVSRATVVPFQTQLLQIPSDHHHQIVHAHRRHSEQGQIRTTPPSSNLQASSRKLPSNFGLTRIKTSFDPPPAPTTNSFPLDFADSPLRSKPAPIDTAPTPRRYREATTSTPVLESTPIAPPPAPLNQHFSHHNFLKQFRSVRFDVSSTSQTPRGPSPNTSPILSQTRPLSTSSMSPITTPFTNLTPITPTPPPLTCPPLPAQYFQHSVPCHQHHIFPSHHQCDSSLQHHPYS
ncbi:hypothetical protein EJ08DRAFT_62021 [Tothia fuscella]|uniref:Uncharacterized protein n=1 Tax=Tothia fuscella TaxID=1048955 RepID=A0A9P4NYE5_9PEZI|nr:hypothetical protein EJ08DRAFT_62021 [Tothia fuscella]